MEAATCRLLLSAGAADAHVDRPFFSCVIALASTSIPQVNVVRLRGFTLIELVVALGIVGVLTTVAVPRLSEVMAGQEIKKGALEFHSALVFARSEGIKRNGVVTVTGLSADMADGWLIAQGATVLRRQAAIVNVTFSGPSSTVTFDGDGRLNSSGRLMFQVRSVTVPTANMRCVVVDSSGRAAVRSDANGDGNCFNG